MDPVHPLKQAHTPVSAGGAPPPQASDVNTPADSFSASGTPGIDMGKAAKIITSKSEYHGDIITLWKYDVKHYDPMAAVGPDGRIYEKGLCDDTLRCFAPDGTIQWEKTMQSTLAERPFVAPDGAVYLSNVLTLEAYNADGSPRFNIPLPDGRDVPHHTLKTELAVGPEGNAYVHDATQLYAVDKKGKLRWSKKIQTWGVDRPVVGQDGKVYTADKQNVISCFDNTGKLLWKNNDFFNEKPGLPDIGTELALGPDGTLYFGINNSATYGHNCGLVAIGPDGKMKWKLPTDSNLSNYESPEVDQATGTIFTGSGRDGQELVAVNPDGTVKWKKEVGLILHVTAMPEGKGVAVGIRGGDLHAFTNEGEPLWTFHTGNIFSKPTFGPDGILYVGSSKSLYAIQPGHDYLEKVAQQQKDHALHPDEEASTPTITEADSWIIIGGVKLPVHSQ